MRRAIRLVAALAALTALAAAPATLAAAPATLAAAPATLAAAPATLAAAPEGLAHVARLQGYFNAAGTVTRAVNVPGERRGERVTRTWAFISSCPSGACAAVTLIRQRGTGYDRLTLHRRRPGYYTGAGAFTAPARCAGRVYSAGERAPYTLTLTVTSAVAAGDAVSATGFTATYRNPSRTGLTRCYTAPSYDSARYVGTPLPPPPSASIRRVRSTRSSTGS